MSIFYVIFLILFIIFIAEIFEGAQREEDDEGLMIVKIVAVGVPVVLGIFFLLPSLIIASVIAVVVKVAITATCKKFNF